MKNKTIFQIFGFDLKDFEWSGYWHNYCMGAKQYVLREDLARTSKCRKRYLKVIQILKAREEIIFDYFFRLKRIQNILYFSTIAVVLKLVFFKSFKFRRIFIVLFRLLVAGLSAITAKIGLRRE